MYKFFVCLITILAPAGWAQQVSPTINQLPSRQFGQPQLLSTLNSIAPNLVEGRELNGPVSVAIDTSSSPPILYVADSNNNRVLAWKNPAALGVCGINNSRCGFADLVVGQRPDFTATLQGGPGRVGLNTGFAGPTAIAVDGAGNLYVVDSGNNRILRFPAPFKQTSALLDTDLVIGQKNKNTGTSANEGGQIPSAKGLNFSSQLITTIAIDSSGGLWVPDAGNNRVLHFPASQLTAGTSEPAADIVLGQFDFQTSNERQPPAGTIGGSPFFKGGMSRPSSVAVAPNGALYVGDAYGRVLYFLPNIPSGSAGVSASRILGLSIPVNGQPAAPTPNNYAIGSQVTGLFMLGNNLFVSDAANHRVVKYDAPENWPAEQDLSQQQPYTKQFSPPMTDVTGQASFTVNKVNKGQPEPDQSSLSSPLGGAFLGTDLWIADFGNNRVISFAQSGGKYVTASRLLGQLDWPYDAPNLIEGREVFFATSNSAFGGLAIDSTSNPPHLFVADTFNHRVLGFRDARNIGGKADLVIGQTDFYRALINGRTNDPQLPNQSGLYQPRGLAVDSSGSLYVADSGNGRVLRFAPPFDQPGDLPLLPNLVLGQSSFTSQTFDASIQTMAAPVGVAFFSDGSLVVSDAGLNRLMVFRKGASGFTNGQAATSVLGQADPNSGNPSNSAAGLNNPRQIAVDTSDRLYVADYGNGRLMVWTNARVAPTGITSSAQFNGLAGTQGVVVSPISGEIWISTTNANQTIRLPEFNQLILNATPDHYTSTGFIQGATAAAAVTLDSSDNPIVAEAANRLTFYFPQMVYKHAASYNTQPIAPGMIVQLGRSGRDFPLQATQAQVFPWPKTLNDIQVTVNGVPAPVYFAGTVINMQVPTQNMPTSGTVEFVVKRVSTSEVLATGVFQMGEFSPGFFTAGALGQGQVAAFNDDGSVNDSAHGVSGDGKHFISFCLTGGGVFSGGPSAAPDDGEAPTGTPRTRIDPIVTLAPPGITLPGDAILYSGAGCGFPGGWQVSVKIPFGVVPGPNNIVVIQMQDVRSNVGPNGATIRTSYTAK